MIPPWLHIVSLVSLAAGVLIGSWIAWDVSRHPQHMGIMNVV